MSGSRCCKTNAFPEKARLLRRHGWGGVMGTRGGSRLFLVQLPHDPLHPVRLWICTNLQGLQRRKSANKEES